MVQLKVEAQAQPTATDKYRKTDGKLKTKYVKLKGEVIAAMEAIDPSKEGKTLAYSDIRKAVRALADYKDLKQDEQPSNSDIKVMCAELAVEDKVVE
jgi:hypothetical protein